MTKIVYNACYGGFNLSDEAYNEYVNRKKLMQEQVHDRYDIPRSDRILASIVQGMGERANGNHAQLCIRELPRGTKYRIDEYDGSERVMTVDDYTWEIA